MIERPGQLRLEAAVGPVLTGNLLFGQLDLCGNQCYRGLSEVLLTLRGRVYLSEIVSKFEPKTWPRCGDSETRPLSLGKKRGTRRVDGVEGSTMLSDAVDIS